MAVAVLAGLTVLVMLGGGGSLIWQQRAAALAVSQAADRGTARMLSTHIFHVIYSGEMLLEQMLILVQRQGPNLERGKGKDRGNLLENLAPPLSEIGYALIVDRTGALVAASHISPAPALDFSDRAWFKAHEAGQDFVLGEPVISRTTGEPVFPISRVLRTSAGQIRAIAVIGIKLQYLERVLAESHDEDDGTAALFHVEGTLIARDPPIPLASRFPDAKVLKRVQKQPYGSYETAMSAIDGLARQITYESIANYPLLVVVSHSTDAILAPWRQFSLWLGALLAAVTLALVMTARMAMDSDRTAHQEP